MLLGTVLLAFAFPAVWWWRVTHTMSRALALTADLDQRVFPRPTPSGEVREVAACAEAVLDALPRFPSPLRTFAGEGLQGTEPLSALSEAQLEQLEVMKRAGAALRRCAGARELAFGQADLTASNDKLLVLARGLRLSWLAEVRGGRVDDVARECVETLSVLSDLTGAYGSIGVFRLSVEDLAPPCLQALRQQSSASKERLRRAWLALPDRAPSNALAVEVMLAYLVPLNFTDFLPADEASRSTRYFVREPDETGVWARVQRGRQLALFGRAFERYLSLVDSPGPARVAASEALDAQTEVFAASGDEAPELEAMVVKLERGRLVLRMLSAVATDAPLPAGVTDTEFVIGELHLRNLIEPVP